MSSVSKRCTCLRMHFIRIVFDMFSLDRFTGGLSHVEADEGEPLNRLNLFASVQEPPLKTWAVRSFFSLRRLILPHALPETADTGRGRQKDREKGTDRQGREGLCDNKNRILTEVDEDEPSNRQNIFTSILDLLLRTWAVKCFFSLR